jgi:hypothetical protein
MAKHVILESYTFSPSTYTVTINGKAVRAEQLLLITNVTQGTVLYNFSDPSLGYSSYTNSVNSASGLESTIIVLEYNTTAMNAGDLLSILVEETYAEMAPSETLRDPVDKLRTSQPQALIDTDFEYGPQPTKWEQLNLLNNRPSAFYDQTSVLTSTQITSITSDNINKIVYVACPWALPAQSPIFVQGTLDQVNVDGWWLVNTSTVGVGFSFRTINSSTLSSVLDPTKTYIYPANFYTGSAIPVSGMTVNAGTTSVTVTTTFAHGLRQGDGVYVLNNTGASGGITTGSFSVVTTPQTNIFTFFSTATVSGTITPVTTATLYPRPLGYVEHRAYDGGVQFTNLSPFHGYQVIRQTRRYFRYQSGKGIQFSTGSSLKPQIVNEGLTANGLTITATTRYVHGLSTGSVVQVSGSEQSAYNGIFPVLSVISPIQFTYTALTTPSASPATGYPIIINPYSWYGSSNRIGMFDNQNGFYFEFDGQTIWCVKRSSTGYLSGLGTVTLGSNSVTGDSNAKFASQLKPNDYIVIRGQSYLVQSITSDTQMFIYPEYRGVSSSAVTLNKTINTRYAGPSLAGVPNTWNIDKCDGTGASRFNLDLTKMQMFYIDYSWYGAGAIRFGFKNNRGEVIFVHRIPNNNLNPEAYMRSGNLPARYETNTIPGYTYLTQSLANSSGVGNTIFVNDASLFPSTGTVTIKQSASNAAPGLIEYISYSARTTSTLTISGRAQAGGTSTAVTFSYAVTSPIPVELVSPSQASTVSHWGSSVIMDGQFDDDKGFVFNTGMLTSVALPLVGTRYPLISVRLGPTVDNGTIGLLGVREIINRMQLTLRSMDCFNTGTTCRIDLILNGIPSAGTWTNVGGSSLAQTALHITGTTINGGESVYSFFTNNGAATSQELGLVRDIGNSILGGGTTSTVSNSLTAGNRYPDGPDIITVCATPITAPGATINARISWTEAQA